MLTNHSNTDKFFSRKSIRSSKRNKKRTVNQYSVIHNYIFIKNRCHTVTITKHSFVISDKLFFSIKLLTIGIRHLGLPTLAGIFFARYASFSDRGANVCQKNLHICCSVLTQSVTTIIFSAAIVQNPKSFIAAKAHGISLIFFRGSPR